MRLRTLPLAAAAAMLLLTACESSEERAEAFFQNGLELREAGDLDRAAVEFRNVFRFDGAHLEARRNLAEILLQQDRVNAAYSQYLRLAEQYPDRADIRAALARIAIADQSWQEAERHGRAAIELAPGDIQTRAIAVALDFREAALADDDAARDEAFRAARSILRDNPELMTPRRVVISHLLETERQREALPYLDEAIAIEPQRREYSMLKLQVLARLEDDEALRAHLRETYERFPEDTEIRQALISYYMSQEDYDAAEAFLRELAGPEDGEPEGYVTVVRFLEAAYGREAAEAELQRLIDVNGADSENGRLYRGMLAAYDYDSGDREAAIAQLEDILDGAPASDQTRRIKGTLAQMRLAGGNVVGARALIEEILGEDESNVVALKLRARLRIEADEPGEAIIDLRRALDQSPRDTETILLLADAHARNGSPELVGERLAAAVDVSGGGVTESLRYAAHLLGEDRRGAARTVLTDARAANPGSVEILRELGRLALEDEAYVQVRGIIADLERLETDGAADLAQSMQSALLLRQNRIEDGVALLQERAGSDGGDANAVLAVIRTLLAEGATDEAQSYLDALRQTSPDDPRLRLIEASLAAATGDAAEAEEGLRALIDELPQAEAPVQQLYRLLLQQGRQDEASELLTQALEAQPRSRVLRLFRAAQLERETDIDGAIAVYEALYEENSGDVVVANNLASLLSGQAEDGSPELARAAAVARRLRGTEVPAFQDTYGWIAARQGELDEALDYLEPAAAALTGNGLVQYHLGATYARLGRDAEAAAALEQALELGADSPLPQYETAREILAGLDPETSGGDGAGGPGAGADTDAAGSREGTTGAGTDDGAAEADANDDAADAATDAGAAGAATDTGAAGAATDTGAAANR